MKQKYMSFLATLLVLCLALTGCGSISKSQTSKAQESSESNDSREASAGAVEDGLGSGRYLVYATNEDASAIYKGVCTLDLDSKTDEQKVNTLINCLEKPEDMDFDGQKEKPEDPVSILPDNLIRSAELKVQEAATPYSESKKVLDVYVNETVYDKLSTNQKLVLRTGFSQTVFQLDICSAICFLAAGKAANQQPLDTVTAYDRMIINQYNEDFYTDAVKVTLYFASADGKNLVPEDRVLNLSMTKPLPYAIVEALIEGPEEKGHLSTLPSGSQINDVVMEDGICYVDMNDAFQLNHSGGELEEKLTIYSIVDSLASVNGFEYCQILIDGKRVPLYKTSLKIDQFLEPDLTLIQDENSESSE